ncbi:MAG: hypothetical protein GF383_07390 [Candidatus Lokiarchaeota archaeon]|nr:hypothetical protein [Candidatus Lokiarchaeota archaeon]MBD3340013.1 hypothetical protein [Candidatus Lokiarchaeota archaeon]
MEDRLNNRKEPYSEKFKEAFRHFYYEVKKYLDKHYGVDQRSVRYADIADYILGFLSTDGDLDPEVYLDRDLGDYDQEILFEVTRFCEDKIWNEQKSEIKDDDDFNLF